MCFKTGYGHQLVVFMLKVTGPTYYPGRNSGDSELLCGKGQLFKELWNDQNLDSVGKEQIRYPAGKYQENKDTYWEQWSLSHECVELLTTGSFVKALIYVTD